MKRARFSRTEKMMLVAVTGLSGLLLGLGLWRQARSALPTVDIPTPVMPQPNAFDIYVQAGNLIVPCPVPLGPRAMTLMPDELTNQILEPAPTATFKAWLGLNQPTLQTLRSGFAYSYLQPPSRASSGSYPYRRKFRGLAWLLVMESRVKAEQGEWLGATQSALDILRLGTDIPHGGTTMAASGGRFIQSMGREQLWPLMAHLNLTQTRTALDRLKAMDESRVSYANPLQEEKWSGQTRLLDLMRRNSLWQALDEDIYSARLHTSFLKNDLVMRHYTQMMDAQIANARRPFTAPQLPITLPAWSWSDPITPTRFDDDIADQSRVNRISAANNEAGNALLLVALALRAFRLEHGAYPQRLTDLTPRYLARIPADPFGGGEPLRYNRVKVRYKVADISPKVFAPPPPPNFASDDPSPFLSLPAATPRIYHYGELPYTLYSIGPDGNDDGGKAIESFDLNVTRRYHFIRDSKSNVVLGDVVAGVNF